MSDYRITEVAKESGAAHPYRIVVGCGCGYCSRARSYNKKIEERKMNNKNKKMEAWKLKIKKGMIGKCCEDRRCRRPFVSVGEMQVNHHVRVNHGRDIMMERDNVSVCHKSEGSPEDYDNGVHTGNVRRVEVLAYRYGLEASQRAKGRMVERGYSFRSEGE